MPTHEGRLRVLLSGHPLALTVERMAHATREDCLEAVLQVIPVLVEVNTDGALRKM